jgi:hypothetical protein
MWSLSELAAWAEIFCALYLAYRITIKGRRDINPAPFLDFFWNLLFSSPANRDPISGQLLLLVVLGAGITLAEALDATGSINNLLLSREEGMAVGADFDVELVFGRPGIDHIAAQAGDRAVDVIRMNVVLHCSICLNLGLVIPEFLSPDRSDRLGRAEGKKK